MKLTRLWVMSLCGVLCISALAHCSESGKRAVEKKTLKKDMPSQQSTIYNIKRLEIKDRFTEHHQQQQQQPHHEEQHTQPQQQTRTEKQNEPAKHNQLQKHIQQQQQQLQSLGIAPKMAIDGKQQRRTKKFKNSTKNSHGLNKKLLNKLGFTKVKAPNSHNRKRLAVESRRHASPDDSHMFIIKLPPNMHYYSNPSSNNGNDNKKNSILPQAAKHPADPKHKTATIAMTTKDVEALNNNNGKKVLFPFNSNGRPGRIYHWNLPVLQKILEDKQRFSNLSKTTKDQLIDIKDVPTWTKPWENDTIDKSYSKANYKKSLKRKSPTYYAPANAVNKNSFNKYFAGNGKPKGFYVIKENQKKPQYFQNIIS